MAVVSHVFSRLKFTAVSIILDPEHSNSITIFHSLLLIRYSDAAECLAINGSHCKGRMNGALDDVSECCTELQWFPKLPSPLQTYCKFLPL
jgi:hypothetical protein